VNYLLGDLPKKKRLQSQNKNILVNAIIEKIEGSSVEKIAKFRVMCYEFLPKLIPIEKNENNKKIRSRSYDQILKAAPTMEESHSLMSNIKWPEDKIFPF
jgi:hypothetical protein